MLQPKPELLYDSEYFVSPKLLQSEQSEPLRDDEKKYLKKLHKQERRKRVIARTAMGGMVILQSLYWGDVLYNQSVENEAKPSIVKIAPPLDPGNDDVATFVLNGFNTMDADDYSRINLEAIQQIGDGNLLSVQYNNASFDGEAFLKTIESYLDDNNISTVNFMFISMGNLPGTTIAADVAVNSNSEVGSLQHYMSPSGTEGVKPLRKDEMSVAAVAAEHIPGSADSTFWRLVVEWYFYNSEYTKGSFNGELGHDSKVVTDNIGRFFKVGGSILKSFWDGNYTSNRFMLQQIDALKTADLQENYQTIGENSDDAFVVYWGGKNDDIVDQNISSTQIHQFSDSVQMPFFQYEIPDASHTAYWKTTEEFKDTAITAAKEIPDKIEAYHDYYNNITLERLLEEGYFALEADDDKK